MKKKYQKFNEEGECMPVGAAAAAAGWIWAGISSMRSSVSLWPGVEKEDDEAVIPAGLSS